MYGLFLLSLTLSTDVLLLSEMKVYNLLIEKSKPDFDRNARRLWADVYFVMQNQSPSHIIHIFVAESRSHFVNKTYEYEKRSRQC